MALPSAQTVAPCEAYWAADAVFVGRVTAVRRVGTARMVALTVVDGFRGVAESSVDALMDTSASPCRVSFRIGGEYVDLCHALGWRWTQYRLPEDP